MVDIRVRGTATVSFSTDLGVDVDDLVSEYLNDTLGSEFELEDVEIQDLEVN